MSEIKKKFFSFFSPPENRNAVTMSRRNVESGCGGGIEISKNRHDVMPSRRNVLFEKMSDSVETEFLDVKNRVAELH